MNVTPVQRLNVDLRLNASLTNRKRGQPSEYFNSSESIETVPGDPYKLSTLYPGKGSEVWDNVLEQLRGTKEKNRSVRLRANFKLGYDIIDGLNISTSLAADYSVHRRNYFSPSYLNSNGYSSSVGETAINLMVLNENLLSYQKTIKEYHNISFVAGFSYQYDQMEYNGGSAENSPSDKIYYAPQGMPDVGEEEYWGTKRAIAFQHYQSDMQEKVLLSYFARLEYNYMKKYYFPRVFVGTVVPCSGRITNGVLSLLSRLVGPLRKNRLCSPTHHGLISVNSGRVGESQGCTLIRLIWP